MSADGRIFVVGPGRYLGPQIARHLSERWRVNELSLDALAGASLTDRDVVINGSFEPALYASNYQPSLDRDRTASDAVCGSCARYVMLSSRAVYPSRLDPPLDERERPSPSSVYGSNKCRIEAALQQVLGDRLLILRLGNVFGQEPIGRRTFVSSALASLGASGQIKLDISGDTHKDFVPLSFVVRAIAALLRNGESGIFNIGSGSALPIRTVAEALVRGFGKGEIALLGEARKGEEFCLDITKLRERTGLTIEADEVISQLERTARELR